MMLLNFPPVELAQPEADGLEDWKRLEVQRESFMVLLF
jgi:hypothetical protein